MSGHDYEADLRAWHEDVLTTLDVTDEEAAILRKEFAERERGKYTVSSWRQHLADRLFEIRTGMKI